MTTRALAVAILCVLLGAGIWVVLDPGGFGLVDTEADQGQSPIDRELADDDSTQAGVEQSEGEQREAIVVESTEAADANELLNRPVEMGIPSFKGTLLLANGKAASNATVSAFGFRRLVRGLRPDDPKQRPTVQRAVRTATDGRFRIPESPMEELHWVLRFEFEDVASFDLVDLSSIPGRTRDLGKLRFGQAATIRGVVIAENGAPVLEAEVRALRSSQGPRLSRWLEGDLYPIDTPSVRTNRNGEFEMTGLPAGSLRLTADFPGFQSGLSTEVETTDGSTVENVQLVLVESRPVHGVVQATEGQTIAGARVRATWKPNGTLTEQTDMQGKFSLDLPEDANELNLRVTAPGFTILQQRVRAQQRDQLLQLTLASAPTLAGQVVDEEGAPIVGAFVALFEQSQQRIASIAPWQQESLVRTESGADGRFELAYDPSASLDRRLRVIAWTERHMPARSRTLNFEQRNGLAPTRLAEDITLTLKLGLVAAGSVSTPTGEPAAGARVMLRRDGGQPNALAGSLAASQGEIVARTTAKSRGEFEFEGLSPGDYHLEAHLPGFSPARGENFGLVDQHWSESLRLSYPTSIRGEVVGDRSALNRLQVVAIAEGRSYPCLVRSDNSFHIPEVAPGPYQVHVFADAGGLGDAWGRRIGPNLSEPQEIEVPEGKTVDLLFELNLGSFAKLAGNVTLNGVPGVDYRVFLIPAGYEGSSSERERQFVAQNLRSTHTDHEGAFKFSGLGELEYWVVLVPPSGSRAGGIGGVFHSNGPMGLARARVSPEAGETYRHNFALQVGVLGGIAVGERKNENEREAVPIRKGVAILTPPKEQVGVRRISVPIGSDGRFQFPPLPIGKWTLELRSEGFRRLRESVTLSVGAEVGGEFRLRLSSSAR